MKILHISPSFFSVESVVGGGERYAYELAYAMSKVRDTTFLSFAREEKESQTGSLREIKIPSILSPLFFKCIDRADIIHCHQVWYHHTDWALIYAKLIKRKSVFATDLGGSQARCLSRYFPIHKQLNGLLFISEYARQIFRKNHPDFPCTYTRVIDGGVNIAKFFPDASIQRNQTILYVGRIVSHKGIEHLIDALGDNHKLEIVGNVYEPDYFDFLKQKATGRNVTFLHNLSDDDLVRKYRSSAVVVQPSIYKNYQGIEINFPELLGLVALEAMACGTPTIVTDVASLPELIRDNVTGFIVPPNNTEALRKKINWILSNRSEASQIGANAAESILTRFTWEQSVEKCLESYMQQERSQ